MKNYIYFLIILFSILLLNHFLPLRESLDSSFPSPLKVQLIPSAADLANAAQDAAQNAAENAQSAANCKSSKTLLQQNSKNSTLIQTDLSKAQVLLTQAQTIIAQNAKDISSNAAILKKAKGSVSNYAASAGSAADNITGLKGSDGSGFPGLSAPGAPMTKAIQLFSGGQQQS